MPGGHGRQQSQTDPTVAPLAPSHATDDCFSVLEVAGVLSGHRLFEFLDSKGIRTEEDGRLRELRRALKGVADGGMSRGCVAAAGLRGDC